MEILKQKTGIDLTFISYRGASAAAADVLAGHIPLCIANMDSLMGQVSAGQAEGDRHDRGERSPVLPDTPSFVEAGFPDLVVTSFSFWAVPKSTPAPIKDKLRAATEKALKEPDVLESMRAGRLRAGHDVGRRSRRLHQDRVPALGRGHPCRGHPAAIAGISSPTCWRPASTWCSAAPRPSPASYRARAY
jgi:hypothetical protein